MSLRVGNSILAGSPIDKTDLDLANSPYTTNRILEIPQNIKLELNNGTLTLKAGSKLYDGTGYSWITQTDMSRTLSTNSTYTFVIEKDKSRFNLPKRCVMPDGYSKLRKAFIEAVLSSLKEETLSLDDKLMNAAKEGDLESVKQLLNLGANVNAKTWNGYSPLGEALSGKSFNTAKFLIEKGADVNCKVIEYLGNEVGDYFITTPLSFACREKNLDMVKFLVEHDADVNAIGEDNMSPLSYACYWEQIEAVKYLINHGADVNFDYKDPMGHNPLSIAKGKGNKELVNILLQNGAKE